ncbi:hypothetical protein Pcinc_009283 [Petrolisthes cinctipes]|uniref:Uncharacterized protein n=1 Tax=Petrolisthes cinctipes TaxID=88211 RepID=A0AAE1G7U5_PETCI|nr:hypothetical protein Pcinc_009250 [Petrolisthes cinctipes]KAK3886636.1 hypothetical protein Pcinc_009283 [Petrolisthes cinctipes]
MSTHLKNGYTLPPEREFCPINLDVPWTRVTMRRQDTKISLHVHDTLRKGATSILVGTVDTDVVVILVGVFYCLVNRYPDLDLWVGFNAGRHFWYYHINSVYLELGKNNCQTLPFFQAFTGCDVTS